jgi:HD-like signal output (HDOD) protein
MNTLNLKQAAAFLHMHLEEVRSRAKRGLIPGAKTGRRWVFLEDDLADFVRSRYASPRQALQVTKESSICHYASELRSGSSTSARQTASEYADLLRLKTKPKPKNSTTS